MQGANVPRPPASLAEVRDLVEALRDELGELGGELLHRSDSDREAWEAILRDLALIKSRVPVRKAGKVRRRAVPESSQK